MPSTEAFYDDLAPFYHLIFPDWEASIARQGAALNGAFFQPLVIARNADV